MAQTLTIEEIAELAEVSRSTVSRVLNNHPSVRPEVRSRVLRVIDEHNYAPGAAARSLASSRTNVLMLLIPRSAAVIFSDPFFPLVIQGITEACADHGYFLMLSMVTNEQEQDFYHRILRAHYVDGIILLSSDIDDPILPLLIKDGVPLVLIGRHPYFQDLSWVDVENRDAARQAVAHLIDLGHRRIGTITGPLDMMVGIERRDGYKQALLEAGLPIVPELVVEGKFTQESGHHAMEQLRLLPQPPTGVFAASDATAIGALRALHAAGLRVPDDVAVVGFDDVPLASFAMPPLTTMHQPIQELGAVAVQLLVERLEHPTAPRRQVWLPATLVQRESAAVRRWKKTEG
jgi:LacI family transcriptional regulator